MTRVALRGLAGRKLRSVLTALAIVLGVALVSGSFVLTDSIQRAFHTIFTGAYVNTGAVVSGKKLVDYSSSGNATVPASLLGKIRSLPQVESAAGSIVDFNNDSDTARILDAKGKTVGSGGNPNFGFGVDPRYPQFTPFTLVHGRWATKSGEVVVDQASAEKEHFRIGQRVRVAVDGIRSYTLVGVAGFGSVKSLGGATIAIFDLRTAQKLLHKGNAFDTIAVKGRDGLSPTALADAIRPVLPSHTQVRTGEAQARADEKDIETWVNIIRWFLLGFGGVALFVGSFVIFNTLSITVVQRARELATLRTLGATRRQVLRSVVLEAFALGLLASLVGLGLGVGLAHGLKSVFSALGLALPTSSLSVETRTVVVALLVGVALTVIAGIVPAVRATRVPPIAAVREGAVLPRRRSKGIAGAVVGAVGLALLLAGLFVHGPAAGPRVLALLVGALGVFLGVALVASRLVAPIVSVVGRPSRRIGGVAGRLAVRNALRNPGRTASTAAALMIGLALVTFVTAFGKALSSSDVDSLRSQVNASYVVTSQSGWSVFSARADAALAKVPGVVHTYAVRNDRGRADGSNATVNGVDGAAVGSLLGVRWRAGGVSGFAGHAALLKLSFAKKHQLAVGDRFGVLTPHGDRLELSVRGVFATPKVDAVLGSVVIPRATFDASFPRPRNIMTLVETRTESAAVERSLKRALGAFPDAKVATRDAWAKSRASGFTQVLNLFYVLLALSVVVSLFGMVNTLALSVFERTRELGMLRAVGMSRRQARRMIRHESIVTALIGAALGIPLGIGLAAAACQALSSWGVSFTVPPRVILFVLIALSAGSLAALLPARRASRLNVLGALQYE
jgi:putative ABC transport system permease protein